MQLLALAAFVAGLALASGAPSTQVKGDPVMTGFDGRTFEFFGAPGKTYNVLAEKNHQLSMKLKEGQMWDHNGTYVTAIGFKYQEHVVVIEEEAESGLKVTLDGEPVVLKKGENEVEHVLGLASGEMSLLRQLHRAEYGNAVEIATDMLNAVAWVTPAGTRDEGGKTQPAYLNFELSLLTTPSGAMTGIVGETYGKAADAEDDFKYHGTEADHELASFFAHPAKSVVGKTAKVGGSRITRARKLIENPVTFPMTATFK